MTPVASMFWTARTEAVSATGKVRLGKELTSNVQGYSDLCFGSQVATRMPQKITYHGRHSWRMISITSDIILEDAAYLVSRAFDSYAFVRWYWAVGKCEAMLERYAARTNQRLRPARPSVVLTDTEKTRKRTRYCFRNLVLILKRRRSDYDTASVRPFGRR